MGPRPKEKSFPTSDSEYHSEEEEGDVVSVMPFNSRRKKSQLPCMLDLFSGTNSVGQYFQKIGYEVVSVDILKSSEPTFCEDILNWDYKIFFPRGHFQVIAAGVPCEEYSRALTLRPRDFEKADALVLKTLEIIDYFNPTIWWIENPKQVFYKQEK